MHVPDVPRRCSGWCLQGQTRGSSERGSCGREPAVRQRTCCVAENLLCGREPAVQQRTCCAAENLLCGCLLCMHPQVACSPRAGHRWRSLSDNQSCSAPTHAPPPPLSPLPETPSQHMIARAAAVAVHLPLPGWSPGRRAQVACKDDAQHQHQHVCVRVCVAAPPPPRP